MKEILERDVRHRSLTVGGRPLLAMLRPPFVPAPLAFVVLPTVFFCLLAPLSLTLAVALGLLEPIAPTTSGRAGSGLVVGA